MSLASIIALGVYRRNTTFGVNIFVSLSDKER